MDSPETSALEKALSKDYWLALKRIPEVKSAIEIRHCYSWIRAAICAISADGLQDKFKVGGIQDLRDFDKGNILHENFGIWQHVWLEAQTKDGLYITDGTAGQLDSSYPDGFYGFVEDAPEKLRMVYARKINI
ncbi:hypothetical protein HYS31_01040 [Candidatus Woesearchaeota archaeon]|nr:hypothetical protein [Candidatus Woesearchaeota archaeon]